MLTLNDGRNELWQWDTGRKLSVDADCSQVHFSNKVFGRSIDVDVVDGVAIIPDILLQTDKALMAWAFVGTPENGYTKISRLFNVNKRNKPADYMFTPTDQTTLGEILDRIKDLENRPSGGQVETDPTLSMPGFPADAKAVGDALEDKANQELVDEVVGILSEHENVHDILQKQINNKAGKTEIPKALPNPSKLTIDGDSYDGSVAVDFTSTINGMIEEKMGDGQGGGPGDYELIADITLEEKVSSLEQSVPLGTTEMLVAIKNTSGAISAGMWRLTLGSSESNHNLQVCLDEFMSQKRTTLYVKVVDDRYAIGCYASGNNSAPWSTNHVSESPFSLKLMDKIRIYTSTDNAVANGTSIKIFAR